MRPGKREERQRSLANCFLSICQLSVCLCWSVKLSVLVSSIPLPQNGVKQATHPLDRSLTICPCPCARGMCRNGGKVRMRSPPKKNTFAKVRETTDNSRCHIPLSDVPDASSSMCVCVWVCVRMILWGNYIFLARNVRKMIDV